MVQFCMIELWLLTKANSTKEYNINCLYTIIITKESKSTVSRIKIYFLYYVTEKYLQLNFI